MPQMYDVQLTLPPIPAGEPDVIVTRRLRVTIDGGSVAVADLPVAATTHTVRAPEDATVTVTHALIDDAGLEGPQSPLASFLVADTVAPLVTPPVTFGTPVPVPPVSPPPPPPGRRLLTESDVGPPVVYPSWGGDANYGAGLTHRWVGGELRFLTMTYRGNGTLPNGETHRMELREFALPAPGQPINDTPTRVWGDLWGGTFAGNDTHQSIWMDRANGRLIHAGALDYPQGSISQNACTAISSRALNDDGTISDRTDCHGIEGFGQRAVYGGMKPVPAWFQNAHGVGPYVYGHGGYSSLMAQGLGPSMGLLLAFGPDLPAGGLPWGDTGHTIPAAAVRIGADYRGDYRGVQRSATVNYLDGGDPRSNPSTPPDFPPAEGARHVGPRPDGLYPHSWVMTHGGSLHWLDNDAGTRAVHGLLTVACVGTGKAYYQTSAVYSDGIACELHAFDPADIAAVLAGTKAPNTVEPKSLIVLPMPGLGEFANGRMLGATVVPEMSRLYVLMSFVGPPPVRTALFEYQLPGG